jgi:hypothetical protein
MNTFYTQQYGLLQYNCWSIIIVEHIGFEIILNDNYLIVGIYNFQFDGYSMLKHNLHQFVD